MPFALPSSLVRASALAIALAGFALSQGTLADYQRAQELQTKARGLVVNAPGPANWIGETEHLWYYRAVKGGTEFVWVDAANGEKRLAFDHDRLAAAISSATGHQYTGLALPFAPSPAGRGGGGGRGPGAPTTEPLTFVDNERAIAFGVAGYRWKCSLADYSCAKGEAIPPFPAGGRGGAPAMPQPASDDLLAAPPLEGGDPVDGLEYVSPQQGAGPAAGGGRGAGQPACGSPHLFPAGRQWTRRPRRKQ